MCLKLFLFRSTQYARERNATYSFYSYLFELYIFLFRCMYYTARLVMYFIFKHQLRWRRRCTVFCCSVNCIYLGASLSYVFFVFFSERLFNKYLSLLNQ